ncbi:DUF5302 domain-containing protein [Yinghuangia sp. ASG 101]|uniref:DUF5302 domain-containing protein n=1 Tax=Yinghuangia sp. ASG 101 TaxID=2896848 RepID=UPI001E5BF45C|nr:DUF5302 domain-containing protein [Yinghuangia sp. ASG 101]UGQ13323.1 DUF5302 domain-containing protein [Yinghuangia sp. ASG 101]
MSDDPATDQNTPAATEEGAGDDVKRKFREALDRKRGTKADSVDGGSDGRPKARGAHGPAHQQRNFQRKSG